MSFNSAVNQPNRVFLSSQDDSTINEANSFEWNSFKINLQTPVLNASFAQLLRATIPNAEASSFPNYQCCFWYYRTTGGVSELKNVRFFPSNFQGNTFGCPINRLYANYADLLSDLQTAAAAADSPTLNPFHTAGDVSFAFNGLTRKFSMTGNTLGYTYDLAGYEDEAVFTASKNVFTDVVVPSGQFIPQPVVEYATMNLRLGFSYPGNGGFINFFGAAAGTPIVADSFGNLVYTQNVIIRCNIIAGSCLSSSGLRDSLCVMPIATPALGVAQYAAPLSNPLNRVMKDIYEITILLLDDYMQPYTLPNNAIVNIELGFQYA